VLVTTAGARSIQFPILPVADARDQCDVHEIGQAKNRFGLALGIGVQGLRLRNRSIALEKVENVVALPGATGDEIGEEGDVGAGDMIVADATVATVANMLFGEQIMLVQLPLCAIGAGALG